MNLKWWLNKRRAFYCIPWWRKSLSHAFFVKVEDETLLEPTRQEIALIPGVQSAYYGGSSVRELVEILQTIRWTAAIFTLLCWSYLCIWFIMRFAHPSNPGRQKSESWEPLGNNLLYSDPIWDRRDIDWINGSHSAMDSYVLCLSGSLSYFWRPFNHASAVVYSNWSDEANDGMDFIWQWSVKRLFGQSACCKPVYSKN